MRPVRALVIVAWVGAVVAAVLVLTGVIGAPSRSVIRLADDGLLVFTIPDRPSETPFACDAIGVGDPVTGRLRIDRNASPSAWLEASDGTRLEVAWPEGFVLRNEVPDGVILVTDTGVRVGAVGDLVRLSQTPKGAADGTRDDPYVAAGLVFGGCYRYSP